MYSKFDIKFKKYKNNQQLSYMALETNYYVWLEMWRQAHYTSGVVGDNTTHMGNIN